MMEAQKKSIMLLQEISEICSNENIEFFLTRDTALQAYRSGGFENEKPDIYITMLYRDMIRLLRVLQEKKGEKRELESLYNNGNLKSNFLRYIDSESLYWPIKNPLNFSKFGISITIIPLFSQKNVSKRSLKKFMYLYWSENLGSKWKTKANSFIARMVRKISANICKNASDEKRRKLLDKLYNFELGSSLEDNLYMHKINNLAKISFSPETFQETVLVNFQGIDCKIPKDIDYYFSKIVGKQWKEKQYTAKQVQKFTIVDFEIPYKEYVKSLEQNGLIKEMLSCIEVEKKSQKQYKEYNAPIMKSWDVVLRTDKRIRLWCKYAYKKSHILELYNSEKWDDLRAELEMFDVANRELSKKKMSVSFDKDIWNIYLDLLNHDGEKKFADRINEWLPDEYRGYFTISSKQD